MESLTTFYSAKPEIAKKKKKKKKEKKRQMIQRRENYND
jgi:hypothetical protein